MADEVYDTVLFVAREAFIYRLPHRQTAAGYKAAEWGDMEAFLWKGRLRIIERGSECEIRLEDASSGECSIQIEIRGSSWDKTCYHSTLHSVIWSGHQLIVRSKILVSVRRRNLSPGVRDCRADSLFLALSIILSMLDIRWTFRSIPIRLIREISRASPRFLSLLCSKSRVWRSRWWKEKGFHWDGFPRSIRFFRFQRRWVVLWTSSW